MSAELMHFAAHPVTLEPRRYEQQPPMPYLKPRGFWVSVTGEDDWPSWCRSEEYATDRLQTAHEVTLRARANILRISSPAELDRFHASYAVQTRFEREYDRDSNGWPINWRLVAHEYDGIIIAPYQWSARLKLDWYYGWDVASGCIWNIEAIESLTVVEAVAAS